MNTAKQALLAAGRIKEIKQGRISNDNHVWLLEQVAAGVQFTDYPKGGKVQVKPATETTPETVAYVKPAVSDTSGKVIAEIHYRYNDERAYVAKPIGKTIFNITEFGMREVCRCGNSLVACWCAQPVIHGEVPVEVVRR